MKGFLRRVLWPAVAMMVLMTLLTGAAYPALVTAVAQVVFPGQANGSMVTTSDGRVIGSALIGQCFDQPRYFWGRPSVAGTASDNPCGYDGNASGGSNLGPTSQALLDRINAQVADWRSQYGDAPIPVDLVTTSASGLDPDISPAAAEYQVQRVAAERAMSDDEIRAAIARHTEGPLLGFLGKSRVHVLQLNLDLDGLLE